MNASSQPTFPTNTFLLLLLHVLYVSLVTLMAKGGFWILGGGFLGIYVTGSNSIYNLAREAWRGKMENREKMNERWRTLEEGRE